MPCYTPNQAYFSLRSDGKKDLKFSNHLARNWRLGLPMPDNSIGVPCGRCRGCRLERSRCVAIRCMHELDMHDQSCFLTLTYAPEHLPKDGSIRKGVMQDFMHDLRQKCSRGFEYLDLKGRECFYQKKQGIRYLYSGEYGEQLSRPHYHALIFGFDFPDRRFFKATKGGRIYVSKTLSDIWPFGHHGIGMVSFESAAYVARYCLKKVNGDLAEDHYAGRQPEFAEPSRRPGLGRPYLEKYFSDIYPRDYVVVRGRQCRPPRYYDNYCEQNYPDIWQQVKAARLERSLELPDDIYSFEALAKKEKQIVNRMKNWTRSIENG